jgi:hypothetical protein
MSARELDLEEMDHVEDVTFPPAERRIVTQAYDLSVHTLLEQWVGGILYVPDYQREWVWDNGRASRLIESLILNIPIPVLYFAETNEALYEVVDGQQRVRSIVSFVNNEFALGGLAVHQEFNGMRFHQLPEREQRFLKTRMIRTIIISNESHPTIKFEIFERLNSGSVALNPQELRNVIYRGSLNQLLRDLTYEPVFRAIIGTKHPRPRMVDEEMILRFFALRQRIAEYRPPLKRFLNSYMREAQTAPVGFLLERQTVFVDAVCKVFSVFGTDAFRLVDADGKRLEKQPNRALYEAQMLAFSWTTDSNDLRERRDTVVQAFATLFKDGDFLDAIQRATGDRSRLMFRVHSAVDALRNANVSMDVPVEFLVEDR